MTTVQTKIQKTSKTLFVIFQIVQVAAVVGTVLTLGALVSCLAGRPDIQGRFMSMEPYQKSRDATVMMSVFLGINLALTGVIYAISTLMGRMFRDIQQEGTPFASKHVRRIKQLVWLVPVLVCLVDTSRTVSEGLKAGQPMIGVEFNLMWLVLSGIFYCLSLIFDYGRKLQQESDETL